MPDDPDNGRLPHVVVRAPGASGPVRAMARQTAEAHARDGAAVWLIADPAATAPGNGVTVVPLADSDTGNWYFCREQQDADRLYRTLLAHSWDPSPARLIFVGCPALALTVVRARRLLGRFRAAVIELAGPEQAPTRAPAEVDEIFTRWAADYVSRHAQSVLPDRATVDGLVSVVVPLFNQGRYVLEAIASVRRDLPEAEIVVVNDGSTDPETRKIFAGLTGVLKVDQDNQGLSAARNAGIRRAAGDFIVPLDADDTLEPGFLRTARRALAGNPDLAYLASHSRYTGLLDLTYVPAGFIPELNLFLHTHGKAPCMFRREAIEAVGGYDPRFRAFEDWEIQVALHRAGRATDVLPVVGHRYRRHADSMTFTVSNGIRGELVRELMDKHLPMLGLDDLRTGMLVLAQLWKSGHEPSTSVLLQRGYADQLSEA